MDGYLYLARLLLGSFYANLPLTTQAKQEDRAIFLSRFVWPLFVQSSSVLFCVYGLPVTANWWWLAPIRPPFRSVAEELRTATATWCETGGKASLLSTPPKPFPWRSCLLGSVDR